MDKELMELMGQSPAQNESDFIFMAIQTADADNDNKDVPRGTYRLSDGGKFFYAKSVEFIPLVNTYQYSSGWNNATRKFKAQSIIFKNWKQDIFSSDGSLACGKLPTKVVKGLSEADQLKQKDIRCKRLLFGLVTATGVDADGVEHTITNVPVVFKSGGKSFSPIGDAIDKLTADNKLMCAHPWVMTTVREKTGGNTTYYVAVEIDTKRSQGMQKDWLELLKKYNEWINVQNKAIYEQFKAVRAKAQDVKDVPVSVVEALTGDFDAAEKEASKKGRPFDDPIEFGEELRAG